MRCAVSVVAASLLVVGLILLEVGATLATDRELGRWALRQLGRSLTWYVQMPEPPNVGAVGPSVEVVQVPERTLHDKLDLSQAFVIREALAERLLERWGNATWLTESERGDLVVDYFSDGASGLVPDAKASLRQIATLVEFAGAKCATERIFRRYPQLLNDFPLDTLHAAFGKGHFAPRRLGTTLTVPLFWARGRSDASVRTDLHCEPIANLAFQFRGERNWTLVDPAYSKALHPAVSSDGRAYFRSRLDPSHGLNFSPRFSVVTRPGDVLFVPSFWWHRVDYVPDSTSIGASLFHFRLQQILLESSHNRLYFALLAPNILKELVGWKTQ